MLFACWYRHRGVEKVRPCRRQSASGICCLRSLRCNQSEVFVTLDGLSHVQRETFSGIPRWAAHFQAHCWHAINARDFTCSRQPRNCYPNPNPRWLGIKRTLTEAHRSSAGDDEHFPLPRVGTTSGEIGRYRAGGGNLLFHRQKASYPLQK